MRRNLNVLTLVLIKCNFQIDSSIRDMEKNFFQLRKKIDKPDSTNLEYEESSSNDFVAQMPMFTNLESIISFFYCFLYLTLHIRFLFW